MSRITLASDLKTRNGVPEGKDARLTNSYVETKGDQSVVRKRPSAQGGIAVGTGTAQGGIGFMIGSTPYFIGFWADTMQTYTGGGTSWNSGTSYVTGDRVAVDFEDYWAISDNTNSQPPSSNWSRTYVPAVVTIWTVGTKIAQPGLSNNPIIWNGSIYCYIDPVTGTPYTSSSGLSWTAHAVNANLVDSHSIAWNGTVFCTMTFAGYTGSFFSMTSTNGVTWSSVDLSWSYGASSGTFAEVIAVGSSLYATLPDGSGIIKSTNDGATWVGTSFPVGYSNPNHYPITWNGSVFCVVPRSSTTSSVAWTSPDGTTWTQRALPSASLWGVVKSLGSTLIAFGSSSKIAYSTDNGANWTAGTSSVGSIGGASTNGTRIVAFNVANANYIHSTDGISWTAATMPTSTDWWATTYGAKFLVMDGTTSCATSTNGA